jgi:endonuclease/exonuclease/phosphatase family metal-dependent hydrolase
MTTKVLAFVILALLTSQAFAYDVVDKNTIRLHVLSYNIKGLPGLIDPAWDQDRYKDIGDILAARKQAGQAPDVVLLQESFGSRTLELQQAAGYPFVAQGPSDFKIISSGLYVLSQYPINSAQTLLYDDLTCGTWDCFASKGAMAVRLQLPDVPFLVTIANTHAQSGDDWNAPRSNQLQEFANFVMSLVNPNIGVIVGGDFNTAPRFPSYHKFVDATKFSSVGETCLAPSNGCNLLNATNRDNLLFKSDDQFFYQSGKQVTIRPISVDRNFATPVKGRMLSDHLGYETVFEIHWD